MAESSSAGNFQECPSTPAAVAREKDSATRVESVGEGSSSQIQAPSVSGGGLGVRKRVDSGGDLSFLSIPRGKKPRMSTMGMPSSFGERDSIGFGLDRLPRHRSLFDDDVSSVSSYFSASPRPGRRSSIRPISSTSSYTISRPPSPMYSQITGVPIGQERVQAGIALMRSASMTSLNTVAPQVYPDSSAKHHLRHTRMTFDYSLPDAASSLPARVLACSAENVVFFTRGNRVHHKTLYTSYNADISQFCKPPKAYGTIRALECAGDALAVGTSNGYIQIWDIQSKKAKFSWRTTNEITALAWSGKVLSVGGIKGSIRHYDLKQMEAEKGKKEKEQSRKPVRHNGQITALQWNGEGKILASGDSNGTVHCWEPNQRVPLDIGEPVSRRKKMQHSGKITALAWCPWQSKMLATGDENGILRLWNVNDKIVGSNAMNPGELDLGCLITGIHFSPQCKEILTTHGRIVGDKTLTSKDKPVPSLGVAVHSLPTLRHVLNYELAGEQKGVISDSLMDSTGTRLIFATPSVNKIDVCDVWSKRKELKKQPSFTDHSQLMIR